MSAVRRPLTCWKLLHFPLRTVRKHFQFNMSAAVLADVGSDKVRNYFHSNNTRSGVSPYKFRRNRLRDSLRSEAIIKKSRSLLLRLRLHSRHDGVIWKWCHALDNDKRKSLYLLRCASSCTIRTCFHIRYDSNQDATDSLSGIAVALLHLRISRQALVRYQSIFYDPGWCLSSSRK